MLVWLDADLTMMEVGPDDFDAVATAMASRRMDVAICAEPLARSIGQVVASNPAMARSVQAAAAQRINLDLPYVSSGLFFCRSVPVLSLWQQLTFAVADWPLFEQNMFNVALHRDRTGFLALDCEEWQAQGPSLDRVMLVPSAQGGRPVARIGNKNIKTLHATSGLPGHLLVATCRMTVRDLDLTGPFKLSCRSRCGCINCSFWRPSSSLMAKRCVGLGFAPPQRGRHPASNLSRSRA
jgi:hypothetical protein